MGEKVPPKPDRIFKIREGEFYSNNYLIAYTPNSNYSPSLILKILKGGFKLIKKAVAILIASIITFSSVTSSFAEPQVSMVSDNDLKYGIETRLSRFNQVSINGTSGYSGIFYSLKKIIGLSIWVQFSIENKDQIAGGTVDVYKNQLLEAVKQFNAAYSEGTDDVEKIALQEEWFVGDSINIAALDQITADYANKYLDKIIRNYPEEEECVNANKKTLRRIYDLIDSFIIEVRSANSLFPADIVTNKDGSYSTKSKGSFSLKGVSKCNSIMSNDKKAKLLRKAKEMSSSELVEEKPESIDNNLALLDRFFKDGTYTSGELLNAYYMIFATSALYDPFTSYVGDDEFKKGLMYITGESEADSDLAKLYGEAKMYKKPLLYREINKRTGKAEGNARPITFGEFIDKVKEGESGALCLQKGMIARSIDDNSYNYYKIDRFKYKANTSLKNTDKENKTEEPPEQQQQSPQDNLGSPPLDNLAPPSGESFLTPGDTTPPNPGAPTPPPDPSPTINQLSGGAVDNSAGTGDAPEEQKADLNQNSTGATQDSTKTYDNKDIDWKETLKDTQHNPDNAVLTNEDQMTPSLFTWGTYANGKKIHMGSILLNNILKDVKNIEKIKKENRGIFINCFGDIVTEDDLVIIPGAANPALYNDGAEYYPYTVAFLKHYPSLDPNSKVFKTQNNMQNNKYCIVIEDSFLEASMRENKIESLDKKDKKDDSKIIPGSRLKADNNFKIYAREIQTENDVKIQSKQEIDLGLQAQMAEFGDDIDSMVIFRKLKFDGKFLNNLINNAKDAIRSVAGKYEAFMIKTLTASMSNDSLEILYASDTKNLTQRDLGLIAHNYYWGIMDDGSGNVTEPNEKLNTETISQYLLPEALNGLSNAKSYIKHKVESYDSMKNDFFSAFKTMIKDFIKDIVSSFGEVRGVIGFRSAYQDPIFGSIMVFAKEYTVYLALIIILITIFRFMSAKADLTSTVFYTAMVLIITFIYTSVVPIYIPMIMNFFNNNISRDLSYTALGYKAEAYEELYTQKEDESGRMDQLTTSLNLYKLNSDDLKALAKSMGLKPNNLVDGTVHAIDKDAGIYLEGNIIKVNLDKLFINYPITGKYVSNGKGGLYYKTQCDKMLSSALDYYTPWNLVMNNFIDSLNNFSQVYQLERNTLNYDGLTKDSFLVNSFINSSIYLLPKDWESVNKMVEPEMATKLKETFGEDTTDFLGLSHLLIDPPKPEATESLWYKTFLLNGYVYTSDDDRSEEDEARLKRKINNLITSVNNLTKVFIEKHRKDFECMSDENIIKIISVYATTILSQKASEYTEVVYPFYLNYEELKLKDVLVASYTNAKDRLESESIEIVDYIDYSVGIGGTILLAVLMIMCYIFTVFVTVLIPVLYLVLGILLLLKLVARRNPKGLIFGFMKCVGIIFICYSISTYSYSIIYNFLKGGLKSLVVQIVIIEMVLETVIRILFAIKDNWSELGNGHLYKATPAALKWLNPVVTALYIKGKFSELTHGESSNIDRDEKIDRMWQAFSNSKSVDEIYDSEVILRKKVNRHKHNDGSRASSIRKMNKTDLDDFRNH